MRDVARRAFLVFVAVVVIFLILNTEANAITVSNVTNKTSMATTVWIIWNTSSEANNTVEYSINSDLSNSSFSAWNNNTSTPEIKLWNLQPNTTYYYRVWSYNATNESDNISSSIYNFTTQECVSYKLVNATDTSITGIDHPIQEAVDMICLDVGTVELNNGTFNISTPIRIRKNNITLMGQGMNETILTRTMPGVSHLIDINKAGDAEGRASWHYNHKDESCYGNYPVVPFDFSAHLWNVVVRDLCIEGGGEYSNDHQGIFGTELVDSMISYVKTENHDMTGILIKNSVNVTIRECVSINDGQGFGIAGGASCSMINNTAIQPWRYDGLETNGAWTSKFTELPQYPATKVLRNRVDGGAAGGIFIYSTFDAIVSRNIAENCWKYGMGVTLSANCLISGNILRKNHQSGLIYETTSDNLNNNFTKNIIYSNVWHGIEFKSHYGGHLGGNIASNTIYNNSEDGIYNPYGQQPILLRNNIIVDNKGAGIKNGTNISYNDVWNNTGGNYVDCDPGDTDISTDPLFADPANGDFHLKSRYGRWNGSAWVQDNVTSPCIDAGDPSDDYSNEPKPNGGRINMGAYGNTPEASKSPSKRKLPVARPVCATGIAILIIVAYWRYRRRRRRMRSGGLIVLVPGVAIEWSSFIYM